MRKIEKSIGKLKKNSQKCEKTLEIGRKYEKNFQRPYFGKKLLKIDIYSYQKCKIKWKNFEKCWTIDENWTKIWKKNNH